MTNASLKVKKSSIYLLGKIAEQTAGLIIAWLLITKLSIAEYGIYNFLLASSVYLGIFSSFGLMPAFQRSFPEFIKNKASSQFYWMIRFGLGFRVVTLVLAVLLVYLFWDTIGPFFQMGDHLQYFLLFAIGIVFLLQANFLQRILETMYLHKYVSYANITYTLGRLVLLSLAFYFDYGLLRVLWIDLITYILLLAIYFLYYKFTFTLNSEHVERPGYFSRLSVFKQFLSYNRFSFFNEMGAVFIHISTDFFIIAHFLGTVALGHYAFVAHISYLVSKFLPAKLMRAVIIPVYFSRYIESADKIEIEKMFRLLSKLAAFILLPIFMMVVVVGQEFIQYVFDPKYLAGYPVMVILFLYYILLSIPADLPLKLVEKTEVVLLGKLSLVYNLVMSITLVQVWGLAGVAVSTTSAIFLKRIFEYNMSKKYASITFPWGDVIKIFLNSLIVGAIAFWGKQFIGDLLTFLIFCPVMMIVYLAVSYLNKAFANEERKLINQFIGKPYFRLLVEG